MLDTAGELVNATRLLMDLQQVSAIVQSFSGCEDPQAIALRAANGLTEKFDCAFARIWLMESDGLFLRLVASSGMYTRIDGFFARVPLGAFKVGKIAQNRIPFLSNSLPDEPWVKDREWAIAHRITGFAGYPLEIGDRLVGVLAVFSHHPLSAEFLEVLQGLCTTLALTLENTRQLQQARQQPAVTTTARVPLSEQLASLLPQARLILMGTERPLPAALSCLLLRSAELLKQSGCSYCRLNYSPTHLTLEAMVSTPAHRTQMADDWPTSDFSDVHFGVTCLGGTLQTIPANQKLMQVVIKLPYPVAAPPLPVRIHLTRPLLQTAFTRLACEAGLTLSSLPNPLTPLVTDDAKAAETSERVLWVAHTCQIAPSQTLGTLDLTIQADELRRAVQAAIANQPWGSPSEPSKLSDREREVLRRLAEGKRDRDIASELFISESTIKFHLNNVLSKLKARTRYQALYLAMTKGWL